MRKIVRILFICMAMGVISYTAIAAELNDSAMLQYKEGEYARSVESYERLKSTAGESADLYLNLGNAYVKSGDLGHALLNYERGLRLRPGDRALRENIDYIKSKVEDSNAAEAKGKKLSVALEDKGFFSNVKDYIVHSQTSNAWAVVAAIFFILACGCCAAYIFIDAVLIRKIGFFGGFLALGLSVILLIFSMMAAASMSRSEAGVITAYKVSLLSEPLVNARVVAAPLNRGTRMEILTEEKDGGGKGKWYKVRLNSDYTGWIKSEDFEVI